MRYDGDHMRVDFQELAHHLATDGGGFCLWVGAGASIAVTNGRTPGWHDLIRGIATSYEVNAPSSPPSDMPQLLEELSQRIGHAAFRKELRARLVEAAESAEFDLEVIVSQAMIGARASALVSFNIEQLTSIPFVSSRNGTTFVGRTLRERSQFALEVAITTQPGITSPPVYFPHGLLIQGNVVMTKSEYDKHMGSLAVATAVHLSVGGDLVIIGMSLGDPYLRDAILQNRRWLRRVYWLGEANDYSEWSRVAEVTFVEVPHTEVWTRLGRTILHADQTGELKKVDTEMRQKGV